MLYALDKEVAARRERRINKLLKASRSPNLDACLENVVCTPARNINPEQISRLAHGQWCHLGQNIVILGSTARTCLQHNLQSYSPMTANNAISPKRSARRSFATPTPVWMKLPGRKSEASTCGS
ncbi:ATP-binding protein [Corynebacterium sp. UMB8791]